jgi:hypothetical protein
VVSLFTHRDAFGCGPVVIGRTGRGGPIRPNAGGTPPTFGVTGAKKSNSPSTGVVMGAVSTRPYVVLINNSAWVSAA